MVTLVGDREYYYSCGMHHFGLPECEVLPVRCRPVKRRTSMNRFNNYLLAENPTLSSGHTFSVAQDAPRFRLTHLKDERHDEEVELFRNPHGIWRLDAV